MTIMGIAGSPRKDGNSFYLIREALTAAKQGKASLETEMVQLADVNIEFCRACESCAQEPYQCVIRDDFESLLNKMENADGILIASPRYGPFGQCPSKMQALLERLVNLSHLPAVTNPDFVFPLENKPCGLLAVSAEGRQNNIPVLHSLEQYALVYRMRVIHASEWPWIGVSGRGNQKGDVLEDHEALKNARQLSSRMVAFLENR